jgi:hypothetical protein
MKLYPRNVKSREGFSVPAVKEDSVNRFDQGKDAAYLKSV